MKINTYCWEGKKNKILNRNFIFKKKNKPLGFKVGNAGDIFVYDLLNKLYGIKVRNTDSSPRILCIGSIAHKSLSGDLLCGVGVKEEALVKNKSQVGEVEITGLRGPLSEKIMRKKGYNTSNVKFELDPGLYMRYFFSEERLDISTGDDIAFIPHYRERHLYPKGSIPDEVKLLDIDSSPLSLAKKILKCKVVFSSSLHGIIFAHALKRPAVFVRPKTEEPLLKYEDYYLSLNRSMPNPMNNIDLKKAAKMTDTDYVPCYSEKDFIFPTDKDLADRKIIVS